jgi:hypothetical protein
MAAASVTDDWLHDDDKGESHLEVNASSASDAKNIAVQERKERRWNKRLNLRLATYTIYPIEIELDVWTGHALEECDDQRSKNYQALERHHPRVYFLDTSTPGHKPRPVMEDPEPNCLMIREVKEMKILEDDNDDERPIMIIFKGHQVLYKCKRINQIEKKNWQEHHLGLNEALRIQRPSTEPRREGSQTASEGFSNHV